MATARRPGRALALAAFAALVLAAGAGGALAAGPPFPDPEPGRAVYDEAGAIRDETEVALERRIDEIEARSGAEVVVYLQVDPTVSEAENLDKARALVDAWGVGRAGFDDGLVILVGLRDNLVNGRVSLFGGGGFTAAYLSEDEMADVIANDFVPYAVTGDLDTALLTTLEAVDRSVTPAARAWLDALRVLNAVLGLVLAPIVLVASVVFAWLAWSRRGRDPELLDSPSIFMAGPPAAMTPPLATVVVDGRPTQHSVNTALVELAATGRIAFRNLDRVRAARSDDEADPETDPAILVHPAPADARPLPRPQHDLHERLRGLSVDGRLAREALWSLNGGPGAELQRRLEREALALGWFTAPPRRSIARMTALGILEVVAGVVAVIIGFAVPVSGAILLGGALGLGGLAVIAFGRQMSQRSHAGARVHAMLKAYRRTLAATLRQARSMEEVVADEEVSVLADTPDRAVVWGIALGLHDEVAGVIERTLEDVREGRRSAASSYVPAWLAGSSTADGASAAASGTSGTISRGGASLFGGAVPNVGGMFAALSSVGSTPASSSSSSGGGFGGGGSSGGGGASGSF